MTNYLSSLFVGFIIGGVFAKLNVDCPAPITIPGVVGILGITLGWLFIHNLKWLML